MFKKIQKLIIKVIEAVYNFLYQTYEGGPTTFGMWMSMTQATALFTLLLDLILTGAIMISGVAGYWIVGWILGWATVAMVMSAVMVVITLFFGLVIPIFAAIYEFFKVCKIKIAAPR